MTSDKAALRRRFLDERKRMTGDKRDARDKTLCDILSSSPMFFGASVVALYSAVRGEIDLLRFASMLDRQGIPLAYPKTEAGGVMHFLLSRPSELTLGRYAIPEPKADAVAAVFDERSICLVPALAFDEGGYRLGYGGGYYDRFLAHFPGISIGICEKPVDFPLPRDTYDRKVNYLLTVDSLLPIL